MGKTGWKIAAFIVVFLLGGSTGFTQGLSGWFDLIYSTSEEKEEGNRVLDDSQFNRNLYLNFRKSVTPMLSYQINLRTNFTDTDLTDAEGETLTTYRRSIEPGIDLIFGNPVYDFNAGYRRQENWDTAHLDNESRETTEFYYARFNVLPQDLPTLNLQYDRQNEFDHIDISELDVSNETYSIGSTYDLPSRDIRFRYTINYSNIINRTPLDPITSKTENDNFDVNYNIGYSGNFWRRKATYSVNYQGNYSRNKREQFVTRTGLIVNQRSPIQGLYAQGSPPPPDENVSADTLGPQSDLVNNDLVTSTGIGLSDAPPPSPGDEFQNIGIRVSASRSVDRLYVYVNQDVRSDSVLNIPGNWEVYKSASNAANTWVLVDISTVTISFVDSVDDISRYEIEFTAPHNESIFKAINLDTSSVDDVFVTEIEAYGIDIAVDDTISDVSKRFEQGLTFNAALRATPKLTFALNYYLDRTDQNPISVGNSFEGFWQNLFSNSISGDSADFRSNIVRNYGASATWLTHRFLTTTLNAQRNEAFDNREQTDVSTNTYNLTFNSVPIPTLSTTLTFIRNDSFTFDEKSSTSDAAILSVGSRLYRDVNMITDLQYARSKSLDTDETTRNTALTGNIDAILTRKLTGQLNYGFRWTSTRDTSKDSQEVTTILTYQPGRFINISANLLLANSDGDGTVSPGIQFDWLPLPAVRLNANYQHTDSDIGPVKTDTTGGYVIWYITKFANLRVTFNYTQQREEIKTESYNVITDLNVRF